METNGLHQWFKKNLWGFIVVLVGFLITFTTIKVQVNANTRDIKDLKELVERVIVLEEREDFIFRDLQEIKADIKEIKQKLQ